MPSHFTSPTPVILTLKDGDEHTVSFLREWYVQYGTTMPAEVVREVAYLDAVDNYVTHDDGQHTWVFERVR